MLRAGGCERCLAPKTGYKSLQCAHFKGRGRYSTRWLEENAAGLCGGCHLYIDSQDDAKTEFFTRLLGEDKLYIVEYQSNHAHKQDMSSLILYYTEKLKEMGEM